MADLSTPTTLDSRPLPGSIQLDACSISNFDQSESHSIALFAKEFSIYQSLFCDHIRGEVVIEDALALTSMMPIIGEEQINLDFRTPSLTPQSSRYAACKIGGPVVKLERMSFQNVQAATYLLHFVSSSRISDLMRVVRDPFGPGQISEFVRKVAKDYLGIEGEKLVVEETQGKHKFVIPSWSPSQTMRFFAREAISAGTKAGNYLWYAALDGEEKHYFKTLDSLLAPNSDNDKAENTYYFTEQSLMKAPGQQDTTPDFAGPGEEFRANPEEWRYIHHIDMRQNFDIEAAVQGGMFDNKVLWVDTLMQQYEAVKVNPNDQKMPHFSYVKNFDQTKHLEPYKFSTMKDGEGRAPHTKGSGDSHIRFLHSTPKQTWEKHQITPRMRQDKLPFLISSFEQLAYIQYSLMVPGDTNRKPGDVITIDMHSFGATDDVLLKKHRYLKGKYLVTAVRHRYIFNLGFYTILEVAKNSFPTEITQGPGKGQ